MPSNQAPAYPSHREVIAMVKTRMMQPGRENEARYVGWSSKQTDYGNALNMGLINRAEYDAAASAAGRLWNYCGGLT